MKKPFYEVKCSGMMGSILLHINVFLLAMLPVYLNRKKIEANNRMPPAWLTICSILIALYAFTSHLGYLPIDSPSDEARRALVSVEMMLSKNYITPTINGELYFLKPPLYNWLLVLSFKLFGNYSTFALRFPMLVSLLLFAIAIFYFVRRNTEHSKLAYITAFAFITTGRILFYDSLLGLIDITYSLLMYCCFMLLYIFGSKQKWKWFFIVSYFMAGIGFLLKGWPSLLALCLSLFTYLFYTRQSKKIFSVDHLYGLIIFLMITGSYYYLYFSGNRLTPDIMLGNLFHESIKRTAIQFSLADGVRHFLLYPFQLLYHFAPWLLFVLVLFRRGAYRLINQHPFIKFNAVIFMTNILVYWTSPQEYPRYVFMLIPLLLSVIFWLFMEHLSPAALLHKTVETILLVLIAIACIIVSSNLFFNFLPVKMDAWKWLLLVMAFSVLLFLFYKQKQLRLEYFILFLLIVRISFNWMVIEQRGKSAFYTLQKSREITSITKDQPLYFRGNIGNTDTWAFHLATQRKEIISINNDSIVYNAFYLAEKKELNNKKGIVFTSMQIPFATDSVVLVKFLPENNQ